MRIEHMTQLRGIIGHYDRCTDIAVPLEWADAQLSCCDVTPLLAREEYLRLFAVRFETGYLHGHFAEAFVQTMLMAMAYHEGWEMDFWARISPEERARVLAEAEDFYREYLCFEQVRLLPIAPGSLEDVARGWVRYKSPEQAVHSEAYIEAQRLLSEFSHAEAVWLGEPCAGSGIPSESWLALHDDAFLLVEYDCCA